MLQRIQTVYWLLAVLLVLLWIFFPYAVIESPAGSFSLYFSDGGQYVSVRFQLRCS